MPGERPHHIEHTLFVPPPPPTTPGCKDEHEERCPGWAESGECDINPAFMVGNVGEPGSCLLSCGRCDLMAYKNSNEVR